MNKAQGRQADDIYVYMWWWLGGLSVFFCFVTRVEIGLNVYSAGRLRIRTQQNCSSSLVERQPDTLSVSPSQSDSTKGCFTKRFVFQACVSFA